MNDVCTEGRLNKSVIWYDLWQLWEMVIYDGTTQSISEVHTENQMYCYYTPPDSW